MCGKQIIQLKSSHKTGKNIWDYMTKGSYPYYVKKL